jgi:Na+/serine symporter
LHSRASSQLEPGVAARADTLRDGLSLSRARLLLFAAAFCAGAINSVAGGGTLLTFPALIWLGLDPKIANATSTVALWPGSSAASWLPP